MTLEHLKGVRATYDPEAKALYIYLPGHDEAVTVDYSREGDDGLIYDVNDKGLTVGIEVLLSKALEIKSGDNGITRTGNLIQTAIIEATNA